MKRVDRTHLILMAVIALFAVFALALLFWLKGRFERERAETIAAVTRHFSPAVLGLPNDLERTFRFADLEQIHATLIPHNAYVRDIVVAKRIAGRGERIVLPFQYSLVHADWQTRLSRLKRYPLSSGDIEYGAIYFDFDNSRLHSVRLAIGSLAMLLVLVLALVAQRLHVQEAALTRTTVELEEKKRELVELERLSLAGRLSANIFHDIRKPLLNIRLEIEEMEAAGPTAADLRERAAGIRRQVELFFSILRDLNIERFIRGDQSGAEFVAVNDLLERSCALVRYERGGVEVVTDFSAALPPVFAFPYRLMQVFSNLILNAYQAMGGHGRLTLTTRQEGAEIVVRIADTGPGIPAEHLPRIFEPFHSTRQDVGGSGLGLYISKGIVEDMGGRIAVAATGPEGTCFEIRLPIGSEPAGG